MTSLPPLIDSFGRRVGKLRLSVTDQCNLRCTYCMPEDGLDWLPKNEVLSYEEMRRLTGLFVATGVKQVRITGGEPLMRRNLEELVAHLDSLRPQGLEAIHLTTNAVLLSRHANTLKQAGLNGVNISLDTLQTDRFNALALRDHLDNVLEGLEAAAHEFPGAVKINAVLERGVNDDEAVALATHGTKLGVEVRFIEKMPLEAQGTWTRNSVLSGDDIQRQLAAVHPLKEIPGRGAAPAARYRWGNGTVGFIDTVTQPFCEACDRVRLTADGSLRNCLFATWETPLKPALRSGATDHELLELIRDNVSRKWAGHQINTPSFTKASRSMSQVGG